eukprot:TRINITY_DN69300_c0_g1_i1.p1 TRINITY_DN69300_c0_g1~~TRINITY_DN69300_c0_g1_i1.p1  ORF type:complete len:451 (-),score=65.06 TRINITY_DN69300_c0_g1_i1:401-1753(-)
MENQRQRRQQPSRKCSGTAQQLALVRSTRNSGVGLAGTSHGGNGGPRGTVDGFVRGGSSPSGDGESRHRSRSARNAVVGSDDKRSHDKREKPHYEFESGEILASRYKLARLLGDGTFGRVVLAFDDSETRHVAVKIIRNEPRYVADGRVEASILKDIIESDAWGLSRVARLLDTFMHGDGFFCLVFEHLGNSLYTVLKYNGGRGYWVQDIQSFGLQLIRALKFLHNQLQLTHTDLKMENVLLESPVEPKISLFPREAFWRATGGATKGPINAYARPASSQIKIIDLGNATYESEPHATLINTRQYRGPEVVLETGWDERSDLWSVGCMLMECYTGKLLFGTHNNLEHLALMERTLGSLPQEVLTAANERAKSAYLVEGKPGRWSLNWPKDATSPSALRRVKCQRRLEEMVLDKHVALADCVREMLTFDPESRPSALEMSRHRFFKDEFED